jgi:hypothetical protein
MEHVRQFDVVDEYAITDHQSGVFEPFYRSAKVAQSFPLLPTQITDTSIRNSEPRAPLPFPP